MILNNYVTQDGAIECRMVLQFCGEKKADEICGKGKTLNK